jgi:hypothetical protein
MDETIQQPDPASAPASAPQQTESVKLGESLLGASAEPQAQPAAADSAETARTPASYEAFTLPEGVAVDGDALKSASDLFAESGLSQAQAQKFIDLATSREQAIAQKSMQAFVDLQNHWVSEIKADPDIGGDRLKASLASAARAIDRLDVPGLREALSFTGAGNHPAVVKAFVRLGRLMSEDRYVPGPLAPRPAPRSPAEVIYDGNPRT